MRLLKTSLSVVAIIGLIFVTVLTATAQRRNGNNGREVTIPVTVQTHNDQERLIADSLDPDDFIVYEEKRQQPLISVLRPAEAPLIVAVLIQDNLVMHVGNEIKAIKNFVRGLPAGSRVMIGYIGGGALQLTQEFTDDREQAVSALRIPLSSPWASAYFPYIQITDAIRRFDSQPKGRRLVLLVSDGLDISRGLRGGAPFFSIDLDRAITEAQRRAVAVYSFYAPSTGWTGRSRIASNYGQGALNRLSDETGGEAYFSGFDFVTFDPYFRELKESLSRQWLITYRSTNTGSGFRRIEIKTDFDLHIHHPAGYRVRK